MKKLNNTDKILGNLQNIKVASTPAWQADFTSMMQRISSPVVTNSSVSRTSDHSLFNLLKIIKMGMQTKIATVAVATILTLGTGGVAVKAADAAVPGSTFYFLDTFGENVSRAVTTDPTAKANLELQILDERLQELTDLQKNAADSKQTKIALEELAHQQEVTKELVKKMNEKTDDAEKEKEKEQITKEYEKHLQEQARELDKIEAEHQGEQEVEDSVNEAQQKQAEAEREMQKQEAEQSFENSNSGTTENKEQEQQQTQTQTRNDDNGSDAGDDHGSDN